MVRTLLVGLAGAAGAVTRYRLGLVVGARSFPWTTLAINMVGSFLIGLVLGGPASSRWSPEATTAVTAGFLGAFTTYSAFAHETSELVRADRAGAAAGYVALSIVGGLAAAGAGHVLARAVV